MYNGDLESRDGGGACVIRQENTQASAQGQVPKQLFGESKPCVFGFTPL